MQDGNSPRNDRQMVNVAPRSGDTESGNNRASLMEKRKADLYNTSELPPIQSAAKTKAPTPNVFQPIIGETIIGQDQNTIHQYEDSP